VREPISTGSRIHDLAAPACRSEMRGPRALTKSLPRQMKPKAKRTGRPLPRWQTGSVLIRQARASRLPRAAKRALRVRACYRLARPCA
jgi:hypothetical protein